MEVIVLHTTITYIGKDAFSGCINLRNIFIPSSVTNFDEYCFYDYRKLKQISIPYLASSIKRW